MGKPRRKRYSVTGPPDWRTYAPGTLAIPPVQKHNKNYGSKRWVWPMTQAELDAWRAKRARAHIADNPEQLDMFRDALAAVDAAEMHRQWVERVRRSSKHL